MGVYKGNDNVSTPDFKYIYYKDKMIYNREVIKDEDIVIDGDYPYWSIEPLNDSYQSYTASEASPCSTTVKDRLLSWQIREGKNSGSATQPADWRADGGWTNNWHVDSASHDSVFSRAWDGTEPIANYYVHSLSGVVNVIPMGYIDDNATQRYLQWVASWFSNGNTGNTTARDAIISGLNFLLRIQYTGDMTTGDARGNPIDFWSDCGGFGQAMPREDGGGASDGGINNYQNRLAFSDESIEYVLQTFQRIIHNVYPWTTAVTNAIYAQDPTLEAKIQTAFDAGIQCVIDAQVKRLNGERTCWAGHHAHQNLVPTWGRHFEPPSLDMRASISMVKFLLTVKNNETRTARTPALKECIHFALKYIQEGGIPNMKYTHNSSPYFISSTGDTMWYRFMRAEDFVGEFAENNTIYTNITSLSSERIGGYTWAGDWGEELLGIDLLPVTYL